MFFVQVGNGEPRPQGGAVAAIEGEQLVHRAIAQQHLHATPQVVAGVRRADGKPFPREGLGILFFPSGAKGPAFIVTDNFAVLKEYNNSDAYAIAVGHLADRMHGGSPIRAAWPKDDRPLPREARIALQKKLAALGYKVNDFEGHVDFDLRDNIRAEQKKLGMVPDGNPTTDLLRKLGMKGQ